MTSTATTTKKLSVVPLRPEDIPRCVDIYLSAFSDNAHSLACFPRGAPAVRTFWEAMLREEMADPDAVFLKAVDAEDGEGEDEEEAAATRSEMELVAFAKWNRPKTRQEQHEQQDEEGEEEHEVQLPVWPAGADSQLCQSTFGEWARAHHRIMGDRPHWYLEMLATDPAHQGRGAGSRLLRYGCEQADRDGVEAYLEASPGGARMYHRHGFEEVGRHETDIRRRASATGGAEDGNGRGESYVNLYMIRQPSPTERSHQPSDT
ncbi:acyl-CoA N-acyltransferase [Microdochium trichocladiopsis]|uniref:Acyl-CoA N-acyltransferase n=1 Tax=Microdochium trichocladiopsis TaxID=1682393 RepID=A0A9P9BSI2_9PEZI|nr:acyl-CoA N-acyltransferase [Microdochium trichocladiopsis]KAH7028871.1 acyl-CoA N-acyltransferase [Microdochium trichocladiopsis]